MAAACSSFSCVPQRHLLFRCPNHPFNRFPVEIKIPDVFTSPSFFRNPLFAPSIGLLLRGKTPHQLSVVKRKMLGCGWEGYNPTSRKWIFEKWSRDKTNRHLIKAIVTVEPEVFASSENSQIRHRMQFESNLECEGLHSSDDGFIDMEEKEMLRRMRISKANKGNVPWNKGRKHSPETLQRIRERTKLAMQDPKVKMKLVNLGHAQSEETRIKIGAGVREGWQRRREMLMVQEGCLFEWQNFIAEASRKGYANEDELQWDSYNIIDEQLKQEWLESVEKRKTMSRPKGSKRAPKSPEQRKKISQAISAKWADPEYRGRVCSALAKYHGVPIGVERKRRRPSGEASSVKRERVKRTSNPKGTDDEVKNIKKVASRTKRNATPSYKDPLANSKFEMIRKIRAERAAMEIKKKEATERAKLLIAEAEKAAKALEVAALKSPLARASLIETRKLIAEATRSIESIESGQLASHDNGDEASFTSDTSVNHFQSSHKALNSRTVLDDRSTDGSLPVSSVQRRQDLSDQGRCKGFDDDRFAFPDAPNVEEPPPSTRSREDEVDPSLRFEPSNAKTDSGVKDLQGCQLKINGSAEYEAPTPKRGGTSKSMDGEGVTGAGKTKKWVRGRLVEVDE